MAFAIRPLIGVPGVPSGLEFSLDNQEIDSAFLAVLRNLSQDEWHRVKRLLVQLGYESDNISSTIEIEWQNFVSFALIHFIACLINNRDLSIFEDPKDVFKCMRSDFTRGTNNSFLSIALLDGRSFRIILPPMNLLLSHPDYRDLPVMFKNKIKIFLQILSIIFFKDKEGEERLLYTGFMIQIKGNGSSYTRLSDVLHDWTIEGNQNPEGLSTSDDEDSKIAHLTFTQRERYVDAPIFYRLRLARFKINGIAAFPSNLIEIPDREVLQRLFEQGEYYIQIFFNFGWFSVQDLIDLLREHMQLVEVPLTDLVTRFFQYFLYSIVLVCWDKPFFQTLKARLMLSRDIQIDIISLLEEILPDCVNSVADNIKTNFGIIAEELTPINPRGLNRGAHNFNLFTGHFDLDDLECIPCGNSLTVGDSQEFLIGCLKENFLDGILALKFEVKALLDICNYEGQIYLEMLKVILRFLEQLYILIYAFSQSSSEL